MDVSASKNSAHNDRTAASLFAPPDEPDADDDPGEALECEVLAVQAGKKAMQHSTAAQTIPRFTPKPPACDVSAGERLAQQTGPHKHNTAIGGIPQHSPRVL